MRTERTDPACRCRGRHEPDPGPGTLFAAPDTAIGKVITQCRQRHRHQEYPGFLREIEKNVPRTLDVHIIVDNYAQTSASQTLVRSEATISGALHSDLCLVVEPGGDLV